MKSTENRKNEKTGQRVRSRSLFGIAVEIWRYRIISMLLMIVPALLLDNLLAALADSSGAPVTTANNEPDRELAPACVHNTQYRSCTCVYCV